MMRTLEATKPTYQVRQGTMRLLVRPSESFDVSAAPAVTVTELAFGALLAGSASLN